MLFSGPMVLAILRELNPKTQTRRVVNDRTMKLFLAAEQLGECGWPPENSSDQQYLAMLCPYGQPGDRLWVKETYQPIWATEEPGDWKTGEGYKIGYVATDGIQEWVDETQGEGELTNKCKPSIFMPRWASRITLEIVSIRVERLQDISNEDSIAEGLTPERASLQCPEQDKRIPPLGSAWSCPGGNTIYGPSMATWAYRELWERINGPGSWDANPWVWVVEFARVSNAADQATAGKKHQPIEGDQA